MAAKALDGDGAQRSSALWIAANENDVTVVRALLEAGASPNASWLKPLIAAARNGNLEIARLLVEAGASVNARPRSGMTALMLAAWDQHLARVQVLVKHKAALNLRDRLGKTALDYAREKGGDEIIEYLRAKGAKRSSELRGTGGRSLPAWRDRGQYAHRFH